MPAAARWAERGRTTRLPLLAGGVFLPSIPAVTPAPLPRCPAAISQRSCGSGQDVLEGSGVPGHGALPGAAGGCAWGGEEPWPAVLPAG